MIDKFRNDIEKLTGNEAKSLLLHILLRLESIKQFSPEQVKDEVAELCTDLVDIPNTQKIQKDYTVVHIVCGESAAGSLRVGLENHHKVIGFPDIFSIGPVWQLHSKDGHHKRYEWLKEHINIPLNEIEDYENKVNHTIEELLLIPENIPIVFWTAENADEQTGLRYLLYLLRKKTNDVYVINTTLTYKELYDTDAIQHFLHHTGEAHPEKLRKIFREKGQNQISTDERHILQKEWLDIASKKDVLRKWENNKVCNIPVNYYDHDLITTVEKLQRKKDKEFLKAARVIGELYGNLEGNVADGFLEYRLRNLIYMGILEIRGIPRDLRSYSVRLKE